MSRQNIFLKIRSFLEWRFSQLCSTCDVDRKNAPLPYESQCFFLYFRFLFGILRFAYFSGGAGPGDFSIFGARLGKKRHRKSATQIYEKQTVLKKYIKKHILENRNCCNTKNKKCRFPKNTNRKTMHCLLVMRSQIFMFFAMLFKVRMFLVRFCELTLNPKFIPCAINPEVVEPRQMHLVTNKFEESRGEALNPKT